MLFAVPIDLHHGHGPGDWQQQFSTIDHIFIDRSQIPRGINLTTSSSSVRYRFLFSDDPLIFILFLFFPRSRCRPDVTNTNVAANRSKRCGIASWNACKNRLAIYAKPNLFTSSDSKSGNGPKKLPREPKTRPNHQLNKPRNWTKGKRRKRMPSRRLDISPEKNLHFFAGSVCHAWVGISFLFLSRRSFHGPFGKKKERIIRRAWSYGHHSFIVGGVRPHALVCVFVHESLLFNIKNNVAITQLTSQRRPHFLALSFYI